MTSLGDSIKATVRHYSEVETTQQKKVPITAARLLAQADRVEELYERLRKPGAQIILGDPVGTGKTAVALIAARELLRRTKVSHLLVSTPNDSVSCLWAERAAIVFGIGPQIIRSHNRVARQDAAMILSRRAKGRPRFPKDLDRDELLVIVDEAHRGLQNEGNASYRSLEAMARGARVLLVTATPYQLAVPGLESMLSIGHSLELKALAEYAASLHTVARLERSRRRDDSITRERMDEAVEHARSKHERAQPELERFLLSPFDREKFGVPSPPHLKASNVISTPKWRTAYNVARIVPEIVDAGKGDMFQRRLVSSSEAFWGGTAGRKLEEDANALGIAPLVDELKSRLGLLDQHPKIRATADWVTSQIQNSNRHVLVFAHFHDTRDALAKVLTKRLGSGRVAAPKNVGDLVKTGDAGTSLQHLFRQMTSEPFVLIVTDAFSESIDLDGGHPCLVHHDLVWNPVRLEQRWGRVVRMSSGFKAVAQQDVFSPVLDTEVDERLFATARARASIGKLLLPLGIDDSDDDLLSLLEPHLDAVAGTDG